MQKVGEIWDMKKDLYEENWEIQLLKRELDFAETWLTAKESFLSDSNYGVSKHNIVQNAKLKPIPKQLYHFWNILITYFYFFSFSPEHWEISFEFLLLLEIRKDAMAGFY